MLGTAPSVIVPVPLTLLVFCAVEADRLIASFPSITPSLFVAIRTWKLLEPAGTLTVPPVSGDHVTPPSVENSWLPVSAPKLAVPEVGVTFTTVGVLLVVFKVTVKTKLPPSPTTGSEISVTTGRSSLEPPIPVPSSLISTVALPVPITTFPGFERFTLKASVPSKILSLAIGIVMVLLVSPGANTTLPTTAVKSDPDVAVPLLVE